jgi:hypothetical protein
LWLFGISSDVHGARFRHAVVARPGAVILVPLPDVALEGGLGVELELVDVDVLAEQLPQRFDQSGMARQQAEHFAEGVGGEGGARRAGLLAPDFLAIELEDGVGFQAQERDLFLGEAVGEETVALLVESLELFGGKLHGRRAPSKLAAVVRLLAAILGCGL